MATAHSAARRMSIRVLMKPASMLAGLPGALPRADNPHGPENPTPDRGRPPIAPRGHLRRRSRAARHRSQRVRLPDPVVPRPHRGELQRAERTLGVRVRARAGLLPAARAGGGSRRRRPARRAASGADRSSSARRSPGSCSRSRSRSSPVAAAIGTPLVEDLFDGSTGLAVCLVIALFTYCTQHLARGTLSGNRRFGSYGFIIGAEGVIRVIPCAILAIAGVDNPAYYGLCLAIPPAIASALALSREHGLLAPGPEAPWNELSSNLGFLLLGSLSAQALSYAPFLGALLLAEDSQEKAVANFLAGLFLARIPILLFQAVQAALLPKLASLYGEGRHDDFRVGLRKLVVVVVGIAALGVLGAATLGPVRRRDPLRREVQPRPRRPRAPGGGQRAVHPGADARPGADRPHGPRAGVRRVARRHRGVRRRHRDRGRGRVPPGRDRRRGRHGHERRS